ncbi:hypothetical protein [Mycobacterium sp. 141]|uniref:hypothetical protein n=1 Tax=Mycobacterium sp. 141 TaxID=1120797 RepID=UPI0018CA1F51|nr:hypothetical protein [Mycobacterium sp. 141]
MLYTEIPTRLLVDAGNVLPNLGYQFEQMDFSGRLEITEDQMLRLLPLIKWLEYIETSWNAEREIDQ